MKWQSLKSRNRFKIRIVPVVLVLLVGCGHHNHEIKEKIIVVPKTTKVKASKLQKPIRLPAELKPAAEVALFARVSGFIRNVLVDRGVKVSAGQLLLVMDAPEIVAQLAEANAKIESARQLLIQRKNESLVSQRYFERLIQSARVPGAVAAQEIESAAAKKSADSAGIVAAEAAILAAQSHAAAISAQLQYLRLTAPFDGTITERNVHPGALVTAGGKSGEKPLLRLETTQALRLTVAVPETYAIALKEGQDIHFTVSALPGDTLSGKIARVAGSLRSDLRAEMVEIDVPNTDNKLKAGMYATVELKFDRNRPSLLVPKSALVITDEKIYVIRKKNDTQFERITVLKGAETDKEVEVFGTLQPDDLIVTEASEDIQTL